MKQTPVLSSPGPAGPGSIHRVTTKATYMKITIGVCGVDMRQLQQAPVVVRRLAAKAA